MSKFIFKNRSIFIACLCLLVSANAIMAQTQSISYQGKLNDGGVPANGIYDFVFRLYNVNGVQFSVDVPVGDVTVTNGVFNVLIPFEETPGIFVVNSRKFLEIAVRPGASTGAYTTLAPRQEFGSVPTAIYARNATESFGAEFARNLLINGNSVPGNLFIQTGDSRLSDARNPLAGSANYIQNSTNLQATTNFNIAGTGKANIFSASTQFNLGDERVLGVGGAGSSTFLGTNNGNLTNTGFYNSFFGNAAGRFLTSGSGNTFIGFQTGEGNTTGNWNTFVGASNGIFINTGSYNSFFGAAAGPIDINSSTVNFATAIGAYSRVNTSDTIVLGKIAGSYNNVARPADTVQIPGILSVAGNTGIGTTAPTARLNVVGNTRFADSSQISQAARGQLEFITTGANANFYMQGAGGTNGINFGVVSATSGGATLFIAQFDGTNYQDRIVVNNTGTVSFTTLGSAGSTPLCRNALNELATCSSSIRYKENINKFNSGLDLVKKLRPVSFDWKANNLRDLGLVAEEVAKAEPLLATYNEKGEVEGVKYDRVGVVLVNAVQEQQAQIERQEKEIREQKDRIERQQTEIEALKALVCVQNPAAEICKPKK